MGTELISRPCCSGRRELFGGPSLADGVADPVEWAGGKDGGTCLTSSAQCYVSVVSRFTRDTSPRPPHPPPSRIELSPISPTRNIIFLSFNGQNDGVAMGMESCTVCFQSGKWRDPPPRLPLRRRVPPCWTANKSLSHRIFRIMCMLEHTV